MKILEIVCTKCHTIVMSCLLCVMLMYNLYMLLYDHIYINLIIIMGVFFITGINILTYSKELKEYVQFHLGLIN